MRLRRIGNDGGALLRRILRDPAVTRTGFAESDAEPHELLTPDARVWSIEDRAGEAGLIWLDTCSLHVRCLDCGLFLVSRGGGLGPRALLAALLYAMDRLSARAVCFAAKEYNRQVIRMCARAGILSYDRRPYQDDYHPDGVSELVYFSIDRSDLARNRDRCLALLRTPVAILDGAGGVEYLASGEKLPR